MPEYTKPALPEPTVFVQGHGAAWNHTAVDAHADACVAAYKAHVRAEQGEPVAWHVCSVNSDGSLSLELARAWEEAAHQHINEAIEDDIDGASGWVVRPVYASPRPLATEPTDSKPTEDDWRTGAIAYLRARYRLRPP